MARIRKSRSSRGLPFPYNTRSKAGNSNQTTKVVQPKAPSTNRQSAEKRRFRPGSKALQEIRYYQRGLYKHSFFFKIIFCETAITFYTGTGYLLPRLPFQRIIREIGGNVLNITPYRRGS